MEQEVYLNIQDRLQLTLDLKRLRMKEQGSILTWVHSTMQQFWEISYLIRTTSLPGKYEENADESIQYMWPTMY